MVFLGHVKGNQHSLINNSIYQTRVRLRVSGRLILMILFATINLWNFNSKVNRHECTNWCKMSQINIKKKKKKKIPKSMKGCISHYINIVLCFCWNASIFPFSEGCLVAYHKNSSWAEGRQLVLKMWMQFWTMLHAKRDLK